MSRGRAGWRPLAAAVAAAGCGGPSSALDPAGPQAGRIAGLWWVLLAVCAAVFVLVLGGLLWSAVRARVPAAAAPPAPELDPEPRRERRLAVVVGGAVVVTVAVIFGVLVASVLTGRALAGLATPDALPVRLVGHQWWWEIEYPDPVPARGVVTANELHVPVGRPVKLTLTSRDVIHSFWIPPLHGKTDLIPGYHNTTWIRADRPGVFEGPCAEFCGLQHAHMRLLVVAEPPDRFAAWLEGQRQPAAAPADPAARRGRDVFLGAGCVRCHTIRGTEAAATAGPDLTHLASRRMLAAGTLPNSAGHLGGWIADAQRLKPGSQMPSASLPPADLAALAAYLETLR